MGDRVSFICFSRAAPQGSKRHLGNGVLVESSKRVKPFRTDLQGVAIEATPVDWDLGLEYHLRVVTSISVVPSPISPARGHSPKRLHYSPPVDRSATLTS